MFKCAWPIRCCLLLLILSAVAMPAVAERSVGVEAGVSASPDQFYVGGNVMAGKVAKDFWFRPSVEIGFGNHTTLAAFNGEFVYLMDLPKSDWTVYFGGGPALNIATFHRTGPGSNSTDVGGGFNFLGGIRKAHGIFAEIKAGVMDSPGFKFGVGYTFK
jgi:hypothetical protein